MKSHTITRDAIIKAHAKAKLRAATQSQITLRDSLIKFKETIIQAHEKQIKYHGKLKGTINTAVIVTVGVGIALKVLPDTVKTVISKSK